MKELETKIQRTEEKIPAMLEELPEILKEDGYPDVRAFMATYRKAEAVVEQYNRDLAAWERHEKPPLWYYPCGGIHKNLICVLQA